MDDSLLMEMQQSVDGLSDIVCSFPFCEESFFPEYVKERRLSYLQDQVEAFVFLVELIEFEAVLMVEGKLDLDLSNKPVNKLGGDLFEADLLDCVN